MDGCAAQVPKRRIAPAALLALTVAIGLPARVVAAQGCPSADLNRDGRVSGADISVLLGDWATDGALSGADLNGSGLVTGADLAMVLEQWSQTCPPLSTPGWATLEEAYPNPAVVTSIALRAAITATGRPWRVRDTATQIEMVLIPPGSFQMGCSPSLIYPCAADELPRHAVSLTNAYYMGRFEITRAQWLSVMGYGPAGGFSFTCYPDSFCRDWPATGVGWVESTDFAGRIGMRLPTEAEWEWACRAGTDTAFHGSRQQPLGTNADEWAYSIAFRQPWGPPGGYSPGDVGQRLPNGFGLHDMVGNAEEWVSDWYGTYPSTSQVDPTGPATGTRRLRRGGSCSGGPREWRSSARNSPEFGAEGALGFRVVRAP